MNNTPKYNRLPFFIPLALAGIWSAFYVAAAFFIFIFLAGSTSFNGQHNSPFTRLSGVLILIGACVQFGMLFSLAYHSSRKKIVILLSMAAASLLLFVPTLGWSAITQGVPVNVNLLVMLMVAAAYKIDQNLRRKALRNAK